jgi:hypothetical protein
MVIKVADASAPAVSARSFRMGVPLKWLREAIACEELPPLNNTTGGFIEQRRMRFRLGLE